ncbi:hypothetical protein [Sphingomonas yantingensis]|uniref:Uncharacterized protein n=1 Tax=Sphingomonas yantingensis TaxID=1241761 RepID=A0A7W9AT75_9SPHN|nr:hypothetical protein [Sphingomonas yantingensis]MBB5700127.1 hypothetical protein [Sphingomonas yantingensis]
MPERLARLETEVAGWDRYVPARPPAPDACFVPVIAVAPTPAGFDLTVGFTLMQGDQKLAGQGVRAALTPTRLPEGTGADDRAADLSAAYAAGNAEQKKRMAAALGNLALGIYRNTELVGQAPAMIQGVGSNPSMLTRIGQFKLAASLLGLQGKGLAGIATSMPKLFSAMKVKAPAAASTSEAEEIAL